MLLILNLTFAFRLESHEKTTTFVIIIRLSLEVWSTRPPLPSTSCESANYFRNWQYLRRHDTALNLLRRHRFFIIIIFFAVLYSIHAFLFQILVLFVFIYFLSRCSHPFFNFICVLSDVVCLFVYFQVICRLLSGIFFSLNVYLRFWWQLRALVQCLVLNIILNTIYFFCIDELKVCHRI